MDGIRDTYLPAYLRERWLKGIVVGGDSAGGMIFPQTILISGPADLTNILSATTKTSSGLGLLPLMLFDAHFVKRQRLNRLVSLVLDHPDHLGIGADEQTAIVIRKEQFTVLGASTVIVLDGRKANLKPAQAGRPSNGRDLRMHVLTHGMKFDLGNAAPRP